MGPPACSKRISSQRPLKFSKPVPTQIMHAILFMNLCYLLLIDMPRPGSYIATETRKSSVNLCPPDYAHHLIHELFIFFGYIHLPFIIDFKLFSFFYSLYSFNSVAAFYKEWLPLQNCRWTHHGGLHLQRIQLRPGIHIYTSLLFFPSYMPSLQTKKIAFFAG